MKINGVDTFTEYGAREWTVVPSHAEIINDGTEWVDDWAVPSLQKSRTGLKTIKVTFLLKNTTRAKMWEDGSRLISALMSPCDVTFENYPHTFRCVIKNAEHAETVLKKWHKLEIELIGFEYSGMLSTSFIAQKTVDTGKTVKNLGTADTPGRIQIDARSGAVTNLNISFRNNGIVYYTAKVSGTFSAILMIDSFNQRIYTSSNSSENPLKLEQVYVQRMPILVPGETVVTTSYTGDTAPKLTLSWYPVYI